MQHLAYQPLQRREHRRQGKCMLSPDRYLPKLKFFQNYFVEHPLLTIKKKNSEGKTMERIKMSRCKQWRGQWGSSMNSTQRLFRQWKYSMWCWNDHIGHYTSVQIHRRDNTKSKAHGKLSIYVCPPSLGSDINHEGGCAGVGAGVVWKISVPSSQLCSEKIRL